MAMKDKRLELDDKLREILGSSNVYFQPPEGKKINYPCIVYERNMIRIGYADNKPYYRFAGYRLTFISHDPDSNVNDRILEMSGVRYERHYNQDGLNHDVYILSFI